jgi:hypothetical protein
VIALLVANLVVGMILVGFMVAPRVYGFIVHHMAKMPCWRRCPDCDDWWCMIHMMHVYECPCPGLEDWLETGIDPYEDTVATYRKAIAAKKGFVFKHEDEEEAEDEDR